MSNLGNIFLSSLNNFLQQTNYLQNVTNFQNSKLLMANNPEYGITEFDVYENPITCGVTFCGSQDKLEKK